MSFTGFVFYIAVRCGFDKHLYLTSCLNAHSHNKCIRLPQTGCTGRKMVLFIISQDRQTQVLADDAMATNHNNRLKLIIFVIIVTPTKCSIASAYNNHSDFITEIRYLEQFDYYNQKQNKVLYVNMENMDVMSPTAPSLVFAREIYTPYTASPIVSLNRLSVGCGTTPKDSLVT